jgi:hypothetical protein
LSDSSLPERMVQWTASPPLEFPADMSLVDALFALNEARQGHAIVIEGSRLVGLFSMTDLMKFASPNQMPRPTWPMGTLVREARRCSPDDPLSQLVALLEESGVLVVGSAGEVADGILTPQVLLAAVVEATEPFLMVADIEQALRAILAEAIPVDDRPEVFGEVLARDDPTFTPPSALEDMGMGDYKSLIGSRRVWERYAGVLEPVFMNRELAIIRIERVRVLRNQIFHFRGPLAPEDAEDLASHHWWVLMRRQVLSNLTATTEDGADA